MFLAKRCTCLNTRNINNRVERGGIDSFSQSQNAKYVTRLIFGETSVQRALGSNNIAPQREFSFSVGGRRMVLQFRGTATSQKRKKLCYVGKENELIIIISDHGKNNNKSACNKPCKCVRKGGFGGSNPPIGLSTKMHNKENITFLALLSLFFCNYMDSNII